MRVWIRLCRRCLRKITPFTSPRWKGIFKKREFDTKGSKNNNKTIGIMHWLAGRLEWEVNDVVGVQYLQCVRATSIQSEFAGVPYSSYSPPDRARQLCALNFRIAASIIAARPILMTTARQSKTKYRNEKKKKRKLESREKKSVRIVTRPRVQHVRWSTVRVRLAGQFFTSCFAF